MFHYFSKTFLCEDSGIDFCLIPAPVLGSYFDFWCRFYRYFCDIDFWLIFWYSFLLTFVANYVQFYGPGGQPLHFSTLSQAPPSLALKIIRCRVKQNRKIAHFLKNRVFWHPGYGKKNHFWSYVRICLTLQLIKSKSLPGDSGSSLAINEI